MRAEAVGARRFGRARARTLHTAEEERNQLLAEIRDDIGVACPQYQELTKTLRQFVARYLAAEEPTGLVLGVVSAGPREGRTTVALGLAGALADMCPNVALVELAGEPGQPTLAMELGLPAGSGLSGYLQNGMSLEDVVQPTGKSNLWLLPAGQTDRPYRLAANSATGALLARLRERYAVTVIDVPALLANEDAPALVGQLDGAVLVVGAGRTRDYEVAEMVSLLGEVPVRGILLNQVRTWTPGWVASLVQPA
jgi:Mrp family chromosome partitioning ATPase